MKKRQTGAEGARQTPADVENIRAKREPLQAERDEVVGAPPARAELTAHLDRTLIEAADRADRGVAARIASRDYGAETLLRAYPQGNDNRVDLLPTVIALFGVDVVRKGLLRFVARAEDGPSPTERAERLAAIDAELLTLEQAEERAIRALEAEGVDIVRRGDASPAVVLGNL